jgi:CheY-like chemotaxis protein
MVTGQMVLVADDDENDIKLLARAFHKAGIVTPLRVVHDGEEVIQYLHGDKPFGDRDSFPMPSLLLLDLKMPRRDGFQVLEWVRRQAGLKRMLIVIMSSSDEPRDIERAYDLGANSFLRKPSDFTSLTKLTQKLHEYWLETNLCPNCASHGRRQPN